MRIIALPITMLTFALASCGRAEHSPRASESLATPRAETVPSAATQQAPVVLVRDLVINPTEAGRELTSVLRIVATAQDTIYALDADEQRVLVFDPNGKFIRQIGRKGSGPGEFTNAQSFALINDSLFVFETSNNRFTAFPIAGGKPLTRTVLIKPTGHGSMQARTPSGLIFAVVNQTGVSRVADYVSTTMDGTRINTILHNVSTDSYFSFNIVRENVKESRYGISYVPQPLIQAPKTDMYPDGSGMLIATLETYGGLRNSSIRLVRAGTSGDTVWSRNLPIVAQRVIDAHMTQLVDWVAAPQMHKGMTLLGDKKMIADSIKHEESWPPIRKVRVARDLSIWITIGGPPWEPVRYWRLSPSGEMQGIYQLPAKFYLLWADNSHVYGTLTNEDFELTIERYRLPE